MGILSWLSRKYILSRFSRKRLDIRYKETFKNKKEEQDFARAIRLTADKAYGLGKCGGGYPYPIDEELF